MIIELIASDIDLVNALLHQILNTSFFKLLNFYSFLHMLGCECGWYPLVINCELHLVLKLHAISKYLKTIVPITK